MLNTQGQATSFMTMGGYLKKDTGCEPVWSSSDANKKPIPKNNYLLLNMQSHAGSN